MADSEGHKRKRKIGLNQIVLKGFAECLLQRLRADATPDGSEPFESYAHDLKMRLFTHEPNFADRFVKGYEVIVTTICDRHT